MQGLNCPMACGLLLPQPGIEPMSPATGRQTPNQWITREVPMKFIEKLFFPSILARVCSVFVNKYPNNFTYFCKSVMKTTAPVINLV